MSTRFKHPVLSLLRPLALASLSLALPLIASAGDDQAGLSADRGAHYPPSHSDFSPLIDKVQRATRQFKYIGNLDSTWVQATPCVSGPNYGAMGIHMLNMDRLHDGELKGEEPDALIYEPQGNGSYQLVGVELIVLASEWAEHHKDSPAAASVDGHLANFVDTPNRYGLPPFFELHVWAWEDNPNGSFADWNSRVSCDKQRPQPVR